MGGRKRELTTTQRKKHAAGLCTEHGCTRKLREPGRYDCQKCHKKKQKERDPIGVYFDHLKQRAKTRPFRGGIGIPVTITRAEFRAFCIEQGFNGRSSATSGRAKTVDRIRQLDGYELGNLQILSRAKNSSKFHGVDKALYYAYKRGLVPNPYEILRDPGGVNLEPDPALDAIVKEIEFPEVSNDNDLIF